MTNVPTEIREIWTDLYKLFDKHFLMPNEDDAWISFWDDARVIYEKGHKNEKLYTGLVAISDYLGDRMKAEANGQ